MMSIIMSKVLHFHTATFNVENILAHPKTKHLHVVHIQPTNVHVYANSLPYLSKN